jgi:hypothetical protein
MLSASHSAQRAWKSRVVHTMSNHRVSGRLTEFLTTPHNQRVRTGKLGNLLVVALLLAVGIVLLPRAAQAHGADHAVGQQQPASDGQYHGSANYPNGSQLHDRSAVRVPFSVLATHCPGGSGSTCCCHDEAAVVSVPLGLATVSRRVLLVTPPSQQHVHFADASPFVSSHLLKSSPPRAPPRSL